MNLEEAIKRLKKDLKECKNDTVVYEFALVFTEDLETVLNYIDNSISKEVVEEKIEELNNGIKRDMINYDKVQDENWKKAIHHSMHNKIDTKNALQELLEGK